MKFIHSLFSTSKEISPRMVRLMALGWFLIASFFIYRLGFAALPRVDQFYFMEERKFFVSDWDYFWHVISFTRSAMIGPADPFLFRPGFFAVLAILDICFRANLYVAGFFSVSLNAFVVFLLYRLVQKMTNGWMGLLAGTLFLLQYPGIEMVIWRHASPYMLGILFFLMGCLWVTDMNAHSLKKTKAISIMVCFLLSTFFHECFAVTLTVCGCLLAALERFDSTGARPRHPERSLALKRSFIFLIPSAIWLMINVADFYGPHATALFGRDDQVSNLALLQVVKNIVLISGIFLKVFPMPHLVAIAFPQKMTGRGEWDFSDQLNGSTGLLGIVLLCLVGFALWLSIGRVKRGHAAGLFPIIFLIFLLAFIVGAAAGRVTLRSFHYLFESTYYYYVSNLFLLLLAVFYGKELWRVCLNPRARNILLVSGALFAVGWAAISYQKIQKLLYERYDTDNFVGRAALETSAVFHQNKGYCYGGSFGHVLYDFFLDRLLYRISCQNRDGGALYLTALPNGSFWLARVSPVNDQTLEVILKNENFAPIDKIPAVLDPYFSRTNPVHMMLSQDSFDITGLSVQMPKNFQGGIVVAYLDPQNFIALQFRDHHLWVRDVNQGVLGTFFYRNEAIFHKDLVELVIKKVDGNFTLFCDQKIVAVMRGHEFIQGRVGVIGNTRDRDALLHLKIARRQGSEEFNFPLIPVFKIASLGIPSQPDQA